MIHFTAMLTRVGSSVVLRLPDETSAALPSRGQVMVAGTMERAPFQAPLEPDGKGSHWLKVDAALLDAAAATAGDTVAMAIEPTRQWPEPDVPADLAEALDADPEAHHVWTDITPMARWDWIRWIGATPQAETRKRRVEVACSKLRSGKRRPCCFNRNICADPSVSRNGILLEPTT